MKVKLDEGARIPTRAYELDAGMDIYSRENKVVPAHGSAVFDTGVHIAIPAGYCGMLKSKSGLNVKHGLTGEGVIDSGYTGSICVKLYNDSEDDYTVKDGDKITQLVIIPVLIDEIEVVDDLPPTARAARGFGSSGK
jgi:dUTP pyrophosphatase